MHRHDEEDDTELTAQRVRNRLLNRRYEKAKKCGDDNVAALLLEMQPAKEALFTIWACTGLTCEPTDYDKLTEYVTTAIAAYRAEHMSQEVEY